MSQLKSLFSVALISSNFMAHSSRNAVFPPFGWRWRSFFFVCLFVWYSTKNSIWYDGCVPSIKTVWLKTDNENESCEKNAKINEWKKNRPEITTNDDEEEKLLNWIHVLCFKLCRVCVCSFYSFSQFKANGWINNRQ